MASVVVEEGTFALKDGKSLYTKTWKPADGDIKARVVLLHGFNDHCSNYEHFCTTLATHGIAVYGYDQRGWGRSVASSQERGRGGSTAVILDDLTQFLERLIAEDRATPIFLKGHSMGGGIALTYAALSPPHIAPHIHGYILNAPLLVLHPKSAPPAFLQRVLALASRVLPNLALPQKIPPEIVSRDPEVQRQFVEDKLGHGIGTAEGLWGMLERGKALVEGKVRVPASVGVWVGHGTGDELTSWEASRKWVEEVFGEAGQAELRLYEGWRHRLHVEPGEDKTMFAKDVVGWIFKRGEGGKEAVGSSSVVAAAGDGDGAEEGQGTVEEAGKKAKL
ncbi:hypothetical protein FGG08_004754 [Glutinoglossum americanum]|uniref:Serine aminopeptidase S33 domain-containing protein n=1 Tax=Glutinoglossum americanum TaxID=1670608 RepID=A0A9P8L3L8_9PEZI|nr:hypothetical protein FGG08_004754 [Glutinoglossum americanum]